MTEDSAREDRALDDRDSEERADDTAVPDNPLGMAGSTPPGTDPYNEPPVMAPGDDRLPDADETTGD